MIVVTGAAGFIGSCLVAKLNEENIRNIILVDDFSRKEKIRNYENKRYRDLVPRYKFFQWIAGKEQDIQIILHMGARTDTAEQDSAIFDTLNIAYSQQIWKLCVAHQIPLIYASSAATYGAGEHGFDDHHRLTPQLTPLNPYGTSKQAFDVWALSQNQKPFFWAGLKFFNVYGPNEYHKERMASVILHAFRQIRNRGKLKLFRSHRSDFADGHQMRDFVYVKDVVEIIYFLMNHRKNPGIYNVGTGKARTFIDLAHTVFDSMQLPSEIEFIDTPADIRDKYQYFTEANMEKLYNIGYAKPFYSLESGVTDYVASYLLKEDVW